MSVDHTKSQKPIKTARIATEIMTTTVELISSRLVGHETFFSSSFASFTNFVALFINAFPLFSAGQEGFEPPTGGFGDRCSTNWSYWPILSPYAWYVFGKTYNT